MFCLLLIDKLSSRTCELKATEDFRNMFLIQIPEFWVWSEHLLFKALIYFWQIGHNTWYYKYTSVFAHFHKYLLIEPLYIEMSDSVGSISKHEKGETYKNPKESIKIKSTIRALGARYQSNSYSVFYEEM